MFKIPEVPTDNLYKFIAIFGLAIFSLAVYAFVDNQQVFEESIEESNKTQAKALFEESQNVSKEIILDERIKILHMKIKFKYGINNTSTISEKDYQKIEDKEQFENDYDNLKEIELQRLLLHDNKFHSKLASDKIHNSVTTYSTFPIGILTLIGIILMSGGFSLWYYRTQKYYDREIKGK